MRVVSEPASGSVMPKAWRRRSPFARRGRMRSFCAALPCRSSVPIVYICACADAAFPPDVLISSRMTEASAIPRPAPPYSAGMSAASHPASVSARTNSSGYALRRSRSRQYASGYFAQRSRTAAWIACCSGVARKSMALASQLPGEDSNLQPTDYPRSRGFPLAWTISLPCASPRLGTGRLVSEPSRGMSLELGCGLPWRLRATGFPQFTQFSVVSFLPTLLFMVTVSRAAVAPPGKVSRILGHYRPDDHACCDHDPLL